MELSEFPVKPLPLKVNISGLNMLLLKRNFITALLLFTLPISLLAQWQVSGGLYPVYQHIPSSSSGLAGVYVLYGVTNVAVAYTASDAAPMKCFRYATSALQSEAVDVRQEGNRVVVADPQPGYGYFIEQNGASVSYMWLMDYQPLQLEMQSLSVDSEGSDCDFTRLIFERKSPDITFFGINGRPETITRTFRLSYSSLIWNDELKEFKETEITENTPGYREMSVTAPFINTTFTLTGDQFLQFWNIPQTVTSPLYEAVALTGEAFAEQHLRDAGNELDKETGELGGSAPVEISFTGFANYPVTTYQAWEISRDADFKVIEATYPDQNLDYSFETEGTVYVRFIISNAMGSCEKIVQTFTVNTSESSLQVPNVFTPESASGSNRVFKVAYRSIIKFEGRIFNRWGNQLFHWTNPADGWDGTVNGKTVPTGAYYYVIEAEGAGGKKYKLKGDINVLRTKN